MKKGFSKNNAKKKNMVRNIVIISCVMLLVLGILLLSISMKNIIQVSSKDNSSINVSQDVASKSTPVVINNLLLGSVYNDTWVSSEKYYFYGDFNTNLSLDVYTSNGKKGKFKVEEMTKDTKGSAVYISTSNSNKNTEYIAVNSDGKDIMPNPALKVSNMTDEDYNNIKEAIGIYSLLNSSINIVEAYDINIDTTTKGRIYVVTNKSGKGMGGYSAVIYTDMSGKSKIVKYSFVANLKNSSEWPIYSFKFIADLNKDGKNELIIQETREFDVNYCVLEYRNNKFVEVLSSEMKI